MKFIFLHKVKNIKNGYKIIRYRINSISYYFLILKIRNVHYANLPEVDAITKAAYVKI